jgi:hypothetical protein
VRRLVVFTQQLGAKAVPQTKAANVNIPNLRRDFGQVNRNMRRWRPFRVVPCPSTCNVISLQGQRVH